MQDIGWQFGEALIPRDTDYVIFEVELPASTSGVADETADVAIDDVWVSEGSCNGAGECTLLAILVHVPYSLL